MSEQRGTLSRRGWPFYIRHLLLSLDPFLAYWLYCHVTCYPPSSAGERRYSVCIYSMNQPATSRTYPISTRSHLSSHILTHIVLLCIPVAMSVAAPVPSPSPQNVTTSLKRPQEESGTSTGKSPDQANKKARLNGDAANGNVNGGGPKDIGKGGRWMVEKLEELERLYKVSILTSAAARPGGQVLMSLKAVVKAATVILQYQTFVIRV